MDATQITLLALDLFSSPGWSADKEIQRLYALSNNAGRHYRRIILSKRNGGKRVVFAPDYLLKTVQRNILKNVLSRFPLSPFATAYQPGRTIISNAQPHCQQSQILKLDIENFFDSINWLSVWRVFRQAQLPCNVVTMLTWLCCYNDALPQGAPTSPAISNLVMRRFDECIGAWCQARGIIYTRYCDDMTFSGSFNARQVKNKVCGLLAEMGLNLNQRKSCLVAACKRQQVTGIVVNDKPQLPRESRRGLRQEVHLCEKYGVISHLSRRGELDLSADTHVQATGYLYALQGRINWLLQINPDDEAFKQARESVKRLLITQK
ncbi:RNA-directed DNA polymerase [Escherichia coli]|uniref:reverse transcriptase family protein n=1 Tax=Escherichia sp. MOD1-EC7003 TaxID=2093900 RepID=UPI000CF78B4B|nr:reverse transcriptase family protein [Escherichia sp. MOD1-EC7003]EGO8361593.1 RNA-directed DNA polymerase [Escherichia coli]EGO8379156.1 RNA-directed DNA polymerase [Escherichia coli]MCH0696213.1 reverse transcriptase family protein [Escherichia coli]